MTIISPRVDPDPKCPWPRSSRPHLDGLPGRDRVRSGGRFGAYSHGALFDGNMHRCIPRFRLNRKDGTNRANENAVRMDLEWAFSICADLESDRKSVV